MIFETDPLAFFGARRKQFGHGFDHLGRLVGVHVTSNTTVSKITKKVNLFFGNIHCGINISINISTAPLRHG